MFEFMESYKAPFSNVKPAGAIKKSDKIEYCVLREMTVNAKGKDKI